MIAYLEGKLAEVSPAQIIVDVQGVGYEVLIPLSSFDRLPVPGRAVRILTHLQVREDAHVLYGFLTLEERNLFKLLINNVSGIGPKIALNVLSGMSVVNFRAAVANNDLRALSSISGVGKKTAERILVELKDKVGMMAGLEALSAQRELSPTDKLQSDAVMALVSLGYKQLEAYQAVKKVVGEDQKEFNLEELVRLSLRHLTS